jgi:hypothetical protein
MQFSFIFEYVADMGSLLDGHLGTAPQSNEAMRLVFLIFLGVRIFSWAQPVAAATPAESSVDLAWKVLPFRTVADAFGRRVADRFFAVEIHIGNNSGHDLLLSGFYFRPPAGRHPQALEPNDPYSLVRSVMERDQQVGARAVMMHAVRSMGPLLSLGGALITGGPVTLAKYGASVGIFSNGIEKGLDAAYPDQTLRHLGRLEANSFQDHLVLRQNEPKRVMVFVSREVAQCAAKLPPGESARCHGLLPWSNQFDPRLVKERLGTLQLHGHALSYSRRIRVESDAVVP